MDTINFNSIINTKGLDEKTLEILSSRPMHVSTDQHLRSVRYQFKKHYPEFFDKSLCFESYASFKTKSGVEFDGSFVMIDEFCKISELSKSGFKATIHFDQYPLLRR